VTSEEQIAEAERLAKESRAALCKVHGELTSEQHSCERRLSYAYDCLSDALGYLADARTLVREAPGCGCAPGTVLCPH
jgi:hypothetical protein